MVIHTVEPEKPEGAREFYRVRSEYYKMTKGGRMICYLKQPCPYLCEDEGCTIYKDRPEVCREFPAVWNEWMEDYCELMRDKYND